MQEIVAVIRENDPDKIILIGGLRHAYDLQFVSEAPLADDNVGYATHPYSNNLAGIDADAAFGNLSSKYPVFATELGYNQIDFLDTSINGVPYRKAIIDYMEARGISWTVWCFDATWETTLLTDVNTFAPSPSGEYFRSRMLELNPHP
jgi:endoglucanase